MVQNINVISVIIPARNEEKRLPICINSINQSYKQFEQSFKNQFETNEIPILEIIVVENRSTDKTEEVAKLLGCIVVKSDAKNLSIIRNTGVKATSGDIVITIDADSRMSQFCLFDIYQCLFAERYIGGGTLIYPDRVSLGIICTGILLAPVALYYGISAGLFFCLKKDFEAIGGFDEKLTSAEDIDFAVRLKAYGKKLYRDKTTTKLRKFKTLVRSYIVTSARKFDKFGDWYFFKDPAKTFRLFMGKSQKDADEIWYDFKE